MTGTQVKWGIQFLADFALLMAQNASNEKLGFWPVGKKSKVSCLARNGSMGVKQVVFYEILFD